MRLILIITTVLAIASAAWAEPMAVSQSVGAGTSRADSPTRILSSWVAMGTMSGPIQSGSIILSGGQAAALIGNTDPVTVVDGSFILAALLGQTSPAEVSLHIRSKTDPNGDSRLDAADLVTSVNNP